MKPLSLGRTLWPSLLLIAAVAGCSKNSATALAPDQIPVAVKQAFQQASGDTKALAGDVVSAVQSQDPATAFNSLQQLEQQKDLTPEQRAIAARAMAATMPQLQTAAQKGNPTAQAVLHRYLSTR